MVKFDIIEGVSIDADTVKKTREAYSLGMIDGKRTAKAISLNDTLINMKYRIGKYEGSSSDEILNDLIDIIISGIDF